MAERGDGQERPKFIAILDKTGRVGMLENNTFMVGWEQPNGRLAWHPHQDIWRLFRQNERVIQQLLGIPIKESSETGSDPKFSMSLPQLQDHLKRVMVPGEISKAQQLAQRVGNLITIVAYEQIPSEEVSKELLLISRELGKVRNELKVVAKGKTQQAAAAETSADFIEPSSEAYDAFTELANQGISIVRSLYVRADTILGWTNQQERQIELLGTAIGAALVEIARGSTSDQVRSLWSERLFEPYNLLEQTLRIRGNPYAEIVNRPGVTHLRGLKETIKQGDLAIVQRRFNDAYVELDKVAQDKKAREAAGIYKRYKKSDRGKN